MKIILLSREITPDPFWNHHETRDQSHSQIKRWDCVD